VDASALVEYLLRTERAAPLEQVIRGPNTELHVPALCDVEVSAALRRGLLTRVIDERRALDALDDYLDLPLTIHGHRALVHRIVALRQNFSAYDAAYVALAERIGAMLVTADDHLGRAAQQAAVVEVFVASTGS
jgi:predicted nucleic acid-binding protein